MSVLPMARHDFDQTDLMKKIFEHGDGDETHLNFSAIDVSNIGYWIYQNAFYEGRDAARGENVANSIVRKMFERDVFKY